MCGYQRHCPATSVLACQDKKKGGKERSGNARGNSDVEKVLGKAGEDGVASAHTVWLSAQYSFHGLREGKLDN